MLLCRSHPEKFFHLLMLLMLSGHAFAEETKITNSDIESPATENSLPENFNFHWQSTYINHQKNNFFSNYSGRNSLLSQREGGSSHSYSFSGTAFFGARLWQGAEIYYNPETFQGIPFGRELLGLGGFQNGELQKGAFNSPVFYTARAFIRQTIDLGGAKEFTPGEANQLAGFNPKNKLVLNVGKIATLDYFDDNTYSHDTRSEFQNFSVFSMGAYGYAADTKGFTYGAVAELYLDNWIIKTARLALPSIPNTSDLDLTLRKNFGQQMEISRFHEINGHAGAVRALIYSQRAYMAQYSTATSIGRQRQQTPDLTVARIGGTRSWGYGLNAEQALQENLGVFARWSWNPGTTETQTLDISNSLSGGLSLKGASWSRPNDTFGFGMASNGISSSEIQYLKLGGLTAFLGDGNLDYRREKVIETFYSAKLKNDLFLTLDFQRIQNPGFNSKRGPVNLLGLRAHFEL
jgi:high affinity Mn2+ porin